MRTYSMIVLMLHAAFPVWADRPVFVPLGRNGVSATIAMGISDDARTIVGYQFETGFPNDAVVWRSTGVEVLPKLAPGVTNAIAYKTNADGTTIVGQSETFAVRWDATGAVENLGLASGSYAYDLTPSGGTIVGRELFLGGGGRAFVLSSSGVTFFADAYEFRSVSSGGDVRVGTVLDGDDRYQAIWADDAGVYSIDHGIDTESSSATSVSADGSTIAGWWHGERDGQWGSECFRWDMTSGHTWLGKLPGWRGGGDGAAAMTADGSVIVGYGATNYSSNPGWDSTASIWTADSGNQILQEYLLAKGTIGLADWHLTLAQDITPDGRAIVGYGYNGDGEIEAWVVYLDPTLAPCVLYGDLFGDNEVDLADLGILLADFGCGGADCEGDVDGDGDTDLSDLGIVLSEYGQSCP